MSKDFFGESAGIGGFESSYLLGAGDRFQLAHALYGEAEILGEFGVVRHATELTGQSCNGVFPKTDALADGSWRSV